MFSYLNQGPEMCDPVGIFEEKRATSVFWKFKVSQTRIHRLPFKLGPQFFVFTLLKLYPFHVNFPKDTAAYPGLGYTGDFLMFNTVVLGIFMEGIKVYFIYM